MSIAALVAAAPLRRGDTSEAVRAVQLALAERGYPLRGTGYFGSATLAAVKEFQAKHGLAVTGEIDPLTAAELDKPSIARTEPPWRLIALKETGVHERGNNAGPDVERYIRGAHCGSVGDPWCAIFQNYTLETAGIPGTRSPAARSFEHHDNFVKLPGPALGAIVTFWRGVKSQGKGHVGTYDGEIGDQIAVHGGNEGDQVQTEFFARSRPGWGLVGYWWPKRDARGNAIPLSVIGAFKPLKHASTGAKVT